jgi:predicted outer membrane protein
MKRFLVGGAVAALLATPSAGYAKKSPPNKRAAALKACKAERAQIGAAAFELKYGTGKKHENAMGRCVSAHLRTKK